MGQIPLAGVDLNLLVVLDVLLRERSVGRTADRLNLTSSAVSHALKRLRQMFNNELLVREGRIMAPTALGRDLAEALPGLMSQVERILAPADTFEPARSTRAFRLAAPDFVTPLVLQLLEKIAREAPGISVELVPFTPAAINAMVQGQFDALVAPGGVRREGLRGRPIASSPWAVFARKGHPAFADWSPSAWASFPHLQVRAAGPDGKGPVDRMAKRLGLKRRIAAVIPYFSAAASALAQSDMLLTVPVVALGETTKVYELERKDVPFELPPLELSLFHNATTGDAPGVRWFLGQIENTFAEVREKP